MADSKLSALTAETSPADTDLTYTASGAEPASKKITWATLKSFFFSGPTITGDATAVTQSSKDNSTKLATTAYVDAQHIGYAMTGNTSIATPADATTYYFGAVGFAGSTSSGYYRFRVPKDGYILKIIVDNFYTGTQPSAETSTLNMKVNGTQYQLTTSFHNEVNQSSFSYTYSSPGVAVVAGDNIEFNWVTPTWATNPGTSIVLRTVVYIE